MSKIDPKQELKQLYNPSIKEFSMVDVPALHFLMMHGEGNPNTSLVYKQAVEALFGLSYTLKFMVKKGASAVDYAVMPLEGLWWVDDMSQFDVHNKDSWKWTVLIMQPEYVTAELVEVARQQLSRKKELPALASLRYERFQEGQAAQIMYIGPYANEADTIARLHNFIERQGGKLLSLIHI